MKQMPPWTRDADDLPPWTGDDYGLLHWLCSRIDDEVEASVAAASRRGCQKRNGSTCWLAMMNKALTSGRTCGRISRRPHSIVAKISSTRTGPQTS